MWRSYGCNNSACVEAEWHDNSNPSGNCVQAQWSTPSWDGACVEAQWTRACDSGPCVDVAYESAPGTESGASVEVVRTIDCPWVHVRDSKDTENSPVLVWAREDWNDGKIVFFIPIRPDAVPESYVPGGKLLREGRDSEAAWYMLGGFTEEAKAAWLYFDQAEVDAFEDGVRDGFFSLARSTASVS